MEQTVKPQKLKAGDTVGIISPSGAVPDSLRGQYDQGIRTLESFGLKVKLGEHVLDRYYYSAGTRDVRLKDFNSVWRYPEVKMVLMSQGGYTGNQLLDGIDYRMIRETPKIFAGMSDGTTLVNAIFARTGVVTYHGPDLLWMCGRKITEPFRENFIKTFFSGEVGQLTPNPNWRHQEKPDLQHSGWKCVRSGKATGILVGGHTRCLMNIMLAGYGPDFRDKILFLEGTDIVGRLDMQLTSLELNGVFRQIKGLIIGWFDDSQSEDQKENRPVSDMILEVTRKYSFPILEIGELGHNVENYVFPIGCIATIDASRKYLSIDETTVL